ncbi:leucine-rich repeat and coiled-coil domain-containing protein PF3D7_0703800-like isoform X2 [Eurosta solidaginis]|uniref:leucine-rich repeat and coiled-coil domain-containing protein PF3D7_0703800-like isoform X2 n=1 Tax=Eurosta solidaginis TaxID=178769 RepID=UPI003530C168
MSQIIKTPAIKRKCGDITAGLFEDNNEFYLNCDFCECTYLQLNTFIQHIYDDHLAQLGLFKQETTTTPLYSHDPFDCYDLKSATEENLINDQEMEAVLKESSDTHFVSNDFETVLLHPTVVEIKEEYQEGVKNLVDVHTGIKDVHNAIDFTNDDDKMTPGSEIPHKEKKSRTKKKKAKNLGRRVKVVDADARSLRKKKKSRKKTTQQTDQKAIHNANDVTNDDEMMSDQNDIHNANDVTNDDEMVSHQNDIHDANDVTNDDDEVLLESLQKTKKDVEKGGRTILNHKLKKLVYHTVL